MFRYTIRELVLLTVIVAMGLGWWISYQRDSALNRELLVSLKEVESAMESHGFMLEVNLQTGKASWSFSPWPIR